MSALSVSPLALVSPLQRLPSYSFPSPALRIARVFFKFTLAFIGATEFEPVVLILIFYSAFSLF